MEAVDICFFPTEPDVIAAMLTLAEVTAGDVVYDLGCGDGRIVIAAARDFGARAVGVDLEIKWLKQARASAIEAGVADRVTFIEENMFNTDLRPATVVALFLWPSVNVRLKPKFLAELRPGSRIVSQAFDMASWEPDKVVAMPDRKVYLWRVGG